MSAPSATMDGGSVYDTSISSMTSYFAGCQHELIVELREMRANVIVALNEAQIAFNDAATNPDDELAAADSDFARDSLQAIVYRYLAKTNDISKSGELDDAYDLWTYSANSLRTVRGKWARMKFFATDLYSDNFPTTEEILKYRQRAPHKLGVDTEAVGETMQRMNLNTGLNRGGLGGTLEQRDVRLTHHSSMDGTSQEPVHEQLQQRHQQPPARQQACQQHHQQQCQVNGDWIAKAANGDGEVVRQVGGDQERSEGVGGGHRHQQPPQKRPTDTDHRRPQTTQVHRHHSNHHPPPPPPSPLTRRQMGAQAA